MGGPKKASCLAPDELRGLRLPDGPTGRAYRRSGAVSSVSWPWFCLAKDALSISTSGARRRRWACRRWPILLLDRARGGLVSAPMLPAWLALSQMYALHVPAAC